MPVNPNDDLRAFLIRQYGFVPGDVVPGPAAAARSAATPAAASAANVELGRTFVSRLQFGSENSLITADASGINQRQGQAVVDALHAQGINDARLVTGPNHRQFIQFTNNEQNLRALGEMGAHVTPSAPTPAAASEGPAKNGGAPAADGSAARNEGAPAAPASNSNVARLRQAVGGDPFSVEIKRLPNGRLAYVVSVPNNFDRSHLNGIVNGDPNNLPSQQVGANSQDIIIPAEQMPGGQAAAEAEAANSTIPSAGRQAARQVGAQSDASDTTTSSPGNSGAARQAASAASGSTAGVFTEAERGTAETLRLADGSLVVRLKVGSRAVSIERWQALKQMEITAERTQYGGSADYYVTMSPADYARISGAQQTGRAAPASTNAAAPPSGDQNPLLTEARKRLQAAGMDPNAASIGPNGELRIALPGDSRVVAADALKVPLRDSEGREVVDRRAIGGRQTAIISAEDAQRAFRVGGWGTLGRAAEVAGEVYTGVGRLLKVLRPAAKIAGIAGPVLVVGAAAVSAGAQAAQGDVKGAGHTLADGVVTAAIPANGSLETSLQSQLHNALGPNANFGGLVAAGFGKNATEQALLPEIVRLQHEMSASFANPDQFRNRIGLIHSVTEKLDKYLSAGGPDAENYAKALGYKSLDDCLKDLRRIEGLTRPVGGPEAQASIPSSTIVGEMQRRMADAGSQANGTAAPGPTAATQPTPPQPAPAVPGQAAAGSAAPAAPPVPQPGAPAQPAAPAAPAQTTTAPAPPSPNPEPTRRTGPNQSRPQAFASGIVPEIPPTPAVQAPPTVTAPTVTTPPPAPTRVAVAPPGQ